MAPKKQRLSIGGSSSSTPQWDQSKFTSLEAWNRYNTSFAKRNLLPERGFRPAPCDGRLNDMIIRKKWIHFTKQPESAVISVVREFYANASADGPSEVTVRGKLVKFDNKAINSLFDLPNYNDHDYLDRGYRSYNQDEIITRLCQPGTAWKVNEFQGEKTSFPQSALSRYGKAWFAFICANIMPSRHLSDVTRERAVLLFAIITGLNVDIGVVIQASIKKAIKSNVASGLPHPSLITRLCKRAKVQWGPDDPTQSPMGIIDHHVIKRFSVWAGGISHEYGEGYLLGPEPAPAAEGATSTQIPEIESTSAGPLATLMASMELMHQKIDTVNHRMDSFTRRIDTVAQRQNIFAQYHAEFANTVASIYASSGGDDVDSMPYQFPEPPVFPPYPPPSPAAGQQTEGGPSDGNQGDDELVDDELGEDDLADDVEGDDAEDTPAD